MGTTHPVVVNEPGRQRCRKRQFLEIANSRSRAASNRPRSSATALGNSPPRRGLDGRGTRSGHQAWRAAERPGAGPELGQGLPPGEQETGSTSTLVDSRPSRRRSSAAEAWRVRGLRRHGSGASRCPSIVAAAVRALAPRPACPGHEGADPATTASRRPSSRVGCGGAGSERTTITHAAVTVPDWGRSVSPPRRDRAEAVREPRPRGCLHAIGSSPGDRSSECPRSVSPRSVGRSSSSPALPGVSARVPGRHVHGRTATS